MIASPICVALDTPDIPRARELARSLKGIAGYVKVGMEFFYAHGRRGYEEIAREGVPVFLDLKLHDIPNTVGAALTSLMRLDPRPAIINVHAAGGMAMMKAAKDAVAGQTKLIAVTVLTSLSDDDLWSAGFERGKYTGAHATQLAQLAKRSGLDGVVCSAREVKVIKAATSKDFLTVVPGIRPADAAVQDQKRVATPREARDDGADILVIGRPITGAADPAKAARAIAESLA
jgi:orotidine-5'-phosphate decarboxylase